MSDALHHVEALRLANLPTPLVHAPHLAAAAGIGSLYVKMDGETGFGLGGNKVRKLEYELGPPRLEGVTHLITTGGPQSNHARVTAAAAAHLGLDCTLVINGAEPEPPSGNAWLHRLFGATIHTVSDRSERDAAMAHTAEEVRAAGGRALVIPLGASTPLGALGYADATVEVLKQLDALDDGAQETWVFIATSSCGTLAGLVLGLSALGRSDVRVIAVSADATVAEIEAETCRLATAANELLLRPSPQPVAPFTATADYIGAGYGIPTPGSRAATALFAERAGILLGPTYTAKAAHGMLDWAERSLIPSGVRTVFWHTGGQPAAFAQEVRKSS